tara:strand:- start:741 stop:1505 length:765 start_codon:yes stop_codon:yes gene_type:complete
MVIIDDKILKDNRLQRLKHDDDNYNYNIDKFIKRQLVNENTYKSIKQLCEKEIQKYNRTYKLNIYKNFYMLIVKVIFELDNDINRWCFNSKIQHFARSGENCKIYKELIVGYINYKDIIIPYTEPSAVMVINSILDYDDNEYKFCSTRSDLKNMFALLVLIGIVEPRYENNNNKVFENYSIFNGYNDEESLSTYMNLTRLLHDKKVEGEFKLDENMIIIKKDDMTFYTEKIKNMNLTDIREIFSLHRFFRNDER